MDNNTNTTETNNQTPVVLNRKIPPYFLAALIVVLFFGVLSYLTFFKKISLFKISEKASPVSEEKALLTIKTKAYSEPSGTGVQIYFSSKEEPVEVSAFQMKFSLPGGTKKENILIKLNPQLESQAWRFPIARFEEEEGVPVIKLSGFRLGNSPYPIKGNLLIASVSSKDKSPLSLTLEEKDTLLYSSDAVTKIPFDKSSE